MTKTFKAFIGPRAPAEEMARDNLRYLLPTVFLVLAAFCLLLSIFQPYWRMKLLAPQYPGGLEVQVYVNRMIGDVREIDGLNHYIGMRPLAEAAQLERSLSIFAVGVLSLLILSAIFVHTRWAAALALPALLYPAIFLGDMYYWMRNFGLNLDPHAALSGAIEPFVPPILGEGLVGQFKTIASMDSGLYLAVLASILILAGLYFHRRAYKPLVEAAQNGNS
ncbi:MAG: cytochrome C [Chloroflexi bacterium]|nr:cytochrome C [Chloroflexota bacterium]MCI0577837.1 cytochrome C [Chloroflexota bacterium]MCI0646134.1 cytochrome C [Chloroflexota bacterium]MCI0731336.1 cytochrome C [Chloroflexota bacterium]